jgi:hypothetical protein
MQQGSGSVDWEQGNASGGWQEGMDAKCWTEFTSPWLAGGALPSQLQPHPVIRLADLLAIGSFVVVDFLPHPQPQPFPAVALGWLESSVNESTTGLQETEQSLSKGSQRHGLQRQMSTAAATSFSNRSRSSSSINSSDWSIWELCWFPWSGRAPVKAADIVSDWSTSFISADSSAPIRKRVNIRNSNGNYL